MQHKLAKIIRENVDELSTKWADIVTDFYPNLTTREVFRKVRASHLLLVRSLIEYDFNYIFKVMKEDFREWILLKNSFRDMMNLEPVYVMLLTEFIKSSKLNVYDQDRIIQLNEELRNSSLRDDFNEVYVGEQEKLFSRQIDELEVLNTVSGTDLVGEEGTDLETDELLATASDPHELLDNTLEEAMKVLGATDGVLAYKMDSTHDVVVQFVDAPEQRDKEIVKRITLEDADEQFDPTVLNAFSQVVDRAVLRNYWNPELVEDLRAQNCPRCPYRNELVTSVRGSIECPILRTLKVNTFFCHQLGQNGEKGFLLLSRNSTPAFAAEDQQFVETLASSMMTIIRNFQLYIRQVQLATTDGMTGLYNHRYFQEALTRELSRSARYGAPITLLYTDIDHFKKFNDTYGHQVGDEVLKLVARTIRRNLRDSDIACRYGGEELVAILPDTPLEGGFAAAEKIRKSIESLIFPVDGKNVRITMSIGVSEYPRNARDKQSLIETADGALYIAKEGGRNQTIMSETDPDAINVEDEASGDEPETEQVDVS
ncbi:MAG TPA: sensor domain-containing diguanylate cyclase [bacterium]|jgi:diguanylate cyclase (GGDEF)-like protein